MNTEYDDNFNDENNYGICPICEEHCILERIDNGIGYYEFGEGSYVHHKYELISECCKAVINS